MGMFRKLHAEAPIVAGRHAHIYIEFDSLKQSLQGLAPVAVYTKKSQTCLAECINSEPRYTQNFISTELFCQFIWT